MEKMKMMLNASVKNLLNAIESRRDAIRFRFDHLVTHLDNLPQEGETANTLRTIWGQEKVLLEDELKFLVFLRERLLEESKRTS